MKVEKWGNPLRGFRYVVDGVDCGESVDLDTMIENDRIKLKEKVLQLRISGTSEASSREGDGSGKQ
jgi:hypothetical protein